MYIPFSERVHINLFLDRLVPPSFFFFFQKKNIFQILFSRNPEYSEVLQFLNYMKMTIFAHCIYQSSAEKHTTDIHMQAHTPTYTLN